MVRTFKEKSPTPLDEGHQRDVDEVPDTQDTLSQTVIFVCGDGLRGVTGDRG